MSATNTDSNRQQQSSELQASQPNYNKIGGWLILVAVGLILAPLRILRSVFIYSLPIFKPETWSALTTQSSEVYHPLLAPLLIGELVGNLFFIALSIILVVLLFRRRKIVPKLAIFYYLSNLIFALTHTYTASLIPTVSINMFDAGSIKEIAGFVVRASIWVPYFLISKRVKGTFIT